jgi:hypothetical protein
MENIRRLKFNGQALREPVVGWGTRLPYAAFMGQSLPAATRLRPRGVTRRRRDFWRPPTSIEVGLDTADSDRPRSPNDPASHPQTSYANHPASGEPRTNR